MKIIKATLVSFFLITSIQANAGIIVSQIGEMLCSHHHCGGSNYDGEGEGARNRNYYETWDHTFDLDGGKVVSATLEIGFTNMELDRNMMPGLWGFGLLEGFGDMWAYSQNPHGEEIVKAYCYNETQFDFIPTSVHCGDYGSGLYYYFTQLVLEIPEDHLDGLENSITIGLSGGVYQPDPDYGAYWLDYSKLTIITEDTVDNLPVNDNAGDNSVTVPEPTTFAIFSLGLIGLVLRHRTSNRN